jgi:catechol 2,3-dioxygenase-like lactoylglutathione lyase family enzyme
MKQSQLVEVCWLWLIACAAGCDNPPPGDEAATESKAGAQPTSSAQEPDDVATDRGKGTPPSPAQASSVAGSHSSQPAAAGVVAAQPAVAGAQASVDADAGTDPQLPDLCSGCAQEPREPTDMTVHLHHVHLNVKSRQQSMQFYEQYFKAQRVLLNGTTQALHVAPTLLLLDERAPAPDGSLPTALQHMGWGSADTAAWYEAAHAQGVQPDTRGLTLFGTNETPTVGEPGSGVLIALSGDVPACFPIPDRASYMYVLGPDQERIEVWSGADGRVNHMHFTAADLNATSAWFQKFLGLPSTTPLLSYQFFVDDILFFFETIGVAADYKPTDDHVLGHVAFAVTDLQAWRTRVQQQNIDLVAEPAAAHGFNSFFVRGPDGLLIELVESAKNPELCPQ